jgi:putative DNA primase/helicase
VDFRHVYNLAARCTPPWTNPERDRRVLRAFQPDSALVQGLNLQTSSTGKLLSNVRNAAIVLSRQTTVRLTFDDFLDRVLVGWSDENLRPLQDADVTRIQVQLQSFGMTGVTVTSVHDAIYLAAKNNPSNVVTAWLDQLKWDGVRRLSLLIQRGFGAIPSRYHVRAGRNMLLAMVARAYVPGSKVDEALVFEGRQGVFKSSALRIIGGKYFKELTADPNSKDFEHQLRGVWLGEFPELHAMRRSDDIARIKQFITNQVDHYRPPYAREMHDYPRRVVLCGSTNEVTYIHDPTGGRRFIPIEVGKIDLGWLRANRDQLFAEAVTLFKAGRKWWIYPREETLERQQARTPDDPWLSTIRCYLYGRSEVDPGEILTHAIRVPLERQTPRDLTRVVGLLRKLQCTKQSRRRIAGRRVSMWAVPPALAGQPCSSAGPTVFSPAASGEPSHPLENATAVDPNLDLIN